MQSTQDLIRLQFTSSFVAPFPPETLELTVKLAYSKVLQFNERESCMNASGVLRGRSCIKCDRVDLSRGERDLFEILLLLEKEILINEKDFERESYLEKNFFARVEWNSFLETKRETKKLCFWFIHIGFEISVFILLYKVCIKNKQRYILWRWISCIPRLNNYNRK